MKRRIALCLIAGCLLGCQAQRSLQSNIGKNNLLIRRHLNDKAEP